MVASPASEPAQALLSRGVDARIYAAQPANAACMLIALLLFLVGIVLIISNPILGLIPGVLLVIIALVVGVLSLLGKGLGAIAAIGSTKTCPDCRSKIPSAAAVCRYCNYRYQQQ